MNITTSILANENFLSALKELPKEKLDEVLDFTEFLLAKERTKKSALKLDPRNDPIFELIGLANEEPFAEKIDQELYG